METFETSPQQQTSSQQSIVLLDDQPSHQGFLRELLKVRHAYFRLRRELEIHKTVTRPAYYSWHEERFGAQSIRIQNLRIVFEEKSLLAKRMNDLYAWRGMTRQKAFAQASLDQQAMKDRRKREEEKAYEAAAQEAAQNAARNERASRARQSRQNENEIFERPESQPTSLDLEIKSYYRKLVRALHPDRLGESSVALRAFWQETQDAYQARDLEKLKMIWTECLVEVEPEADEYQLPDLKLAISRLRLRFNRIQREKIELTKNDPTWRFHKLDKEKLALEIRVELNESESLLREEIEALDREMQAFSREHPAN